MRTFRAVGTGRLPLTASPRSVTGLEFRGKTHAAGQAVYRPTGQRFDPISPPRLRCPRTAGGSPASSAGCGRMRTGPCSSTSPRRRDRPTPCGRGRGEPAWRRSGGLRPGSRGRAGVPLPGRRTAAALLRGATTHHGSGHETLERTRVGISDDGRGRYDAPLITAHLRCPLRASWGTDPPR